MTTAAPPLKGKVALVTGAAGGIGGGIVTALAKLGADIAALDRVEDGLATILPPLRALGVNAEPFCIDLADRAQAIAAVGEVVARMGRVDILVNNAAIGSTNDDIVNVTDEEWDATLAINLTAPFLLSRAAARQMIAQGQGGRIIHISSSSAFRSRFVPTAYAAAKGGLGPLMRSMAGTLGAHDILVNTVVPGLTLTPRSRALMGATDSSVVPEGPLATLNRRLGEPEDIGEMVAFLCLPASRHVTGQFMHVSGGAVV